MTRKQTPTPPPQPLSAATLTGFEVVRFAAYRSVRPKDTHVLTALTRFEGQVECDYSVSFVAEDPRGCVEALRELADWLEMRCLPEQASQRLDRELAQRKPPKRVGRAR